MKCFITISGYISILLIPWFICFSACQNQKHAESSNSIDLQELTVAQIHESFRNGKFTAEELVKAYLDRIKKYDTLINSITEINPQAIAIARQLDVEYNKTGELRPLHGIPMIVKDNYETIDMVTAAGSMALQDYIPKKDAFQIKMLKRAGAIIIAKSNMAEWAFSPMHTVSSTHGTTRNPYNTDYVPAGSSGGTAASIASNFATIGLGTDTGNSIRGPSSHNALVGLRSTLGLTSRAGIIPLYLRNDVGGPMCRTVEDAARVFDIIAGYDPDDPLTAYCRDNLENNYQVQKAQSNLEGIRIGVARQLANPNSMDASIYKLFEAAIRDLNKTGAEIVDPFLIPDFEDIRKDQWCPVFKHDIEQYLASNVQNDSIKTLQDIIEIGSASKFANRRLKRNLASASSLHEDDTTCGDAYTDPKRITYRSAIENQMDEFALDAIIYPSWNYPPARIEAFEEEYKGDNSQIIAPHTGQPAFTVPMGFSSSGLPAGLQFLGKMYSDKKLIQIAYVYEQATKHRKTVLMKASDE